MNFQSAFAASVRLYENYLVSRQ